MLGNNGTDQQLMHQLRPPTPPFLPHLTKLRHAGNCVGSAYRTRSRWPENQLEFTKLMAGEVHHYGEVRHPHSNGEPHQKMAH